MKLTEQVADDQAFWINHGPKINSVKELADALDNGSISDDSFNYHINNNNNDFINWIQGVYQNDKLAKSLKRVKTKQTFIKKLKEEMKPAAAKPAKKVAIKSATKPDTKATKKPAAKKKK